MTQKEAQRQLQRFQKDIEHAIAKDIPIDMGNKAVSMFQKNFENEAFFGSRWKNVWRRINPKVKGAAHSRKILTGETGNLGRSIQMTTQIKGEVTVYSDVAYARIHNEGGTAGRKHRAVIRKRQFIGDHKRLDNAMKKIIEHDIEKILNR